jgi:hypothetical protein
VACHNLRASIAHGSLQGKDLPQSDDLDRQAMLSIAGGARIGVRLAKWGPGDFQAFFDGAPNTNGARVRW